jgi:hypothetical protein
MVAVRRTRSLLSVGWPPDDIGEKGERIFTELVARLEGVPYVVGFGTALGLHRDGRLIPSDTDLDVNMVAGVDVEATVREALDGWPVALERCVDGELRQLVWYPEQLIVDVMFWYPIPIGFAYEKFVLSFDGFTPDWRDTQYGRVPLPGSVEEHLEDLYGMDWTVAKHRVKPW